jgi:hypothetical protein
VRILGIVSETHDAGIAVVENAAPLLVVEGWSLQDIDIISSPHHGTFGGCAEPSLLRLSGTFRPALIC